ncbi:MAG: TonB-dependent receptor, partial [Muribaculaceae bacterium]|nr:TonB-dependent receptor [Muribaculaceae bacterium]
DVAPEKRMFRTPDIYGYLTANWEIFQKFKAILTGTLTGPMTVQHLVGSGTDVDLAVRTQSFFDMGLKFGYCFNIFKDIDLDVTAGISNIFNSYQNDFDSGMLRDSGYMYGPSLPRSINFSVAIAIN